MRRCERSRRARTVLAGVVAVLRTLPASAADEVISDPELQGSKGPAAKGDEVISDPELGGSARAGQGTNAGPSPAAPATTPTYAPSESRPEYPHDAIFRVTLGTRWGVDTQWTRPSQDIVEGTTIGVVEASQRRSEALMLSVGLRARHGFGMRRDGNTRSELDVVPISAFADMTPAEGYHVRAGYQVISMGRFDVFSATNFLAVYDLRSGPVTMPEAAAFGQPAVRFDFDKIPGFTLQAYYLPFFTPDIVSVYGSNYAPVDRYLDASCNAAASTPGAAPCPALDPSENRSTTSTGASSALRALAPAPDFTKPQGAIRATLSGSAGELSATVGTALERIPAFGPSAAFLAAPLTPDLLASEPLVHHDRFGVASLDAATDVGPIQLGFEAAYMMHRTLVANGIGIVPGTGVPMGTAPNPPVSTVANFVEHADLVQGGLRAELVEAAGWAAEVEGFVLAALSTPAESNLSWATMEQGRYWRGVAGGVHFAPPETKLKLEAGGVLFSGPSYLVMPRAEWEAVKTLYLELGAVFVGGPTPTFTTMTGGGASGWTGPMSLGGLFSDVDQVFTGVRWVP